MAKVRYTQAFFDVTTQDDSDIEVYQALLEVFGYRDAEIRTYQGLLEVFGFKQGPLYPDVTVSLIEETTALLTSGAYQQGQSASATHSASRWLVRDANTGAFVYDSGETATDLLTHTPPDGSLPSYTDLTAHAMHKNGSGEWSYYPGAGSAVFQTLVEAAEAAVALKFYDASWTLLSTHVSPGTTDTAYGDFVISEEIAIPATARYVVPCSWKDGSALSQTHTKEVLVDVGKLASAYAPSSFKPEIHDETDVTPALEDVGQVTAATFDIDWSEGLVATVELAADSIMTWSNLEPGRRYGLVVEQDSTGSRLLTWPAAAKHPGGVAPTLSTAAGSKDVFGIIAESASVGHVFKVSGDSK